MIKYDMCKRCNESIVEEIQIGDDLHFKCLTREEMKEHIETNFPHLKDRLK